MKKYQMMAGIFAFSLTAFAQASTFTTTSPTSKGEVISDITEIGGIVVDLVGLNDSRVMSQLSSSSLYRGYADANPLVIHTQSGFDNSITSTLGGGLTEAAFRFSLYDGDSSVGNFDAGQDNQLRVNGVDIDFWGEVLTQETDPLGVALNSGDLSLGFTNNRLDTGWFYLNDSTSLATLYNSIVSTEALSFELNDIDPYDNYYDFTQGIDGSLIDTGSGPVVTPIPEPSTYALMLGGLGLVGFMASRRRQAQA